MATVDEVNSRIEENHRQVMESAKANKTALAEVGARLDDVEQKLARRGGRSAPTTETWGSQLQADETVKSLNSNWRGRTRLAVKAAVTIGSGGGGADGGAGDLVAPDRQGGFIPLQRRKLRVRALFSPGETASNAIEWPMMSGRTNNAAMVAETNLKPQSDITFDLKQWPVRTLAHWMLASKQILDDAPALGSIIDSELRYGLADVEDYQFLMGSGQNENLLGVYTGATAFAAPFEIENPTMIDVLLQAVAQVDDAEFDTDGIVLNPIDWRMIQSLKDNMGRYIGGGPFADQLARLWQLPIATSKTMPRDEFLVGAFKQGAQIFDRQEQTIEISTEDSDNFRKNLVTLRGEERLAFVIKYAGAFVKGSFGNVAGGEAGGNG